MITNNYIKKYISENNYLLKAGKKPSRSFSIFLENNYKGMEDMNMEYWICRNVFSEKLYGDTDLEYETVVLRVVE